MTDPIVLSDHTMFTASTGAIRDAFAEWERRYREEPAQFMEDWQRIAEDEESYGLYRVVPR